MGFQLPDWQDDTQSWFAIIRPGDVRLNDFNIAYDQVIVQRGVDTPAVRFGYLESSLNVPAKASVIFTTTEGSVTLVSPATPAPPAHILSAHYNGTIATLYLNGVLVASAPLTGTLIQEVTPGSKCVFGVTNDPDWSFPCRGIVGDIIALPSGSDQETRQVIEGYLAWKWNCEDLLPVGHPFKAAPPLAGELE
jgi:hypothetical protein